jgi:putative addiction module antidote
VILPKELLARLGAGKGDTIYAIDQPDGIRLTTADPEFEAQMEVARRVMRERRAVLRELAKWQSGYRANSSSPFTTSNLQSTAVRPVCCLTARWPAR